MKRKLILLFCLLLALTGCSKAEHTDSNTQSNYEAEQKEKVVYTSKIEKENCWLCSRQGKTLLPIYAGQSNLGIISINTFDMSPITINRYDDYGNSIEEKAGFMSTTHNSFGEGAITTSVSAHPDRGYADVHIGFTKDAVIDKKSVESILCHGCLTAITEDTWNEPYGVGVINFETLEVRLFEQNITGFTFGDYYVDIDRREKKDNSEWTELDLLIFYCPPRYE